MNFDFPKVFKKYLKKRRDFRTLPFTLIEPNLNFS
jgi:hypothetical protein